LTKREADRIARQADTLRALGFTSVEADQLRRISLTLHRWHERECGSDHACVVRGHVVDGEFIYDDAGDAYEEHAGVSGRARYQRVPDRERGALTRLTAILAARNARVHAEYPQRETELRVYIQTDPRGAALYLIRPGDVPEGASVDSYYDRGVCVY